MSFNTNGTGRSEAKMTLDASGNLLVGKTSTSFSTAGSRLTPDGGGQFVVNEAACVEVNRLSNDGTLVGLYKDGTSVGSIGAKGGTAYLIGSSKGLRVSGSGVIPITTAGANSDATYDIGDQAVRFKKLYLSSGVQFGTTDAAAELLDDYEEGTYEVTITPSTSGTVTLNTAYETAQYTKVGRNVHVSGLLVVTSVSSPVGNFQINLPFTPVNLADRAGDSAASLVVQSVVSANIADFVGTINEGTAVIYVQLGDASTVQDDSAQQLGSGTLISFSATYAAA